MRRFTLAPIKDIAPFSTIEILDNKTNRVYRLGHVRDLRDFLDLINEPRQIPGPSETGKSVYSESVLVSGPDGAPKVKTVEYPYSYLEEAVLIRFSRVVIKPEHGGVLLLRLSPLEQVEALAAEVVRSHQQIERERQDHDIQNRRYAIECYVHTHMHEYSASEHPLDYPTE